MKKNNSKGYRLLSMILTFMMLVGSLYGCKKAEVTDNTASGLSESSPTEQASNAVTQGVSKEPVKLTIWSNWDVTGIASSQADTPFWKAYQKACNVELEFIDATGGKDALSVLATTGDLPDIIIEYDGNLPGGVQQTLANGSIIAINDAMEAGFMPNFKAYLKSDAAVNKLCLNDDGLYAWAPMIRSEDSPLAFNGNMIRQDWIDELGLEVPTTIQEMEDVLLAFKEKKGCEAGYSFAYNVYSRMVMAYGVTEGMYVDENGKIQYGFIQDSYKDFLALFSRWYGMGILDPDGFTQNIDAFYAKVAAGRTGLVWGNTGGELGKFETLKAETPELNFQPIPNPVLKEGDSFPVDISSYRVSNVGAMISSTCSNVEAAAKFIDYAYSEEGIMLTNYGEEGTTYTMADGKPQLTDFVLNNTDGLSPQQALSLYAGNKNKSFITLFQVYPLEVQKKSLEVWATPDAKIKQMPPVTMTAEETDEYNSIMTDINTYVDEKKLAFIFGSQSLDNFDKFIKDIKDNGIDRAIEIQQAAYDRYINR